jgi:hypothetical protein
MYMALATDLEYVKKNAGTDSRTSNLRAVLYGPKDLRIVSNYIKCILSCSHFHTQPGGRADRSAGAGASTSSYQSDRPLWFRS